MYFACVKHFSTIGELVLSRFSELRRRFRSLLVGTVFSRRLVKYLYIEESIAYTRTCSKWDTIQISHLRHIIGAVFDKSRNFAETIHMF